IVDQRDLTIVGGSNKQLGTPLCNVTGSPTDLHTRVVYREHILGEIRCRGLIDGPIGIFPKERKRPLSRRVFAENDQPRFVRGIYPEGDGLERTSILVAYFEP